MTQDTSTEPDDDTLAKRRVPCIVAFIHPFRVVNGRDSPSWSVTIEDVNKRTWDYVALHELVGGVGVGLPEPFHMVFSRDGGVALPPLAHLRSDQESVEFFNRCFAAMLLGGVYCEAISLDGLDFGSIIDWKYIRVMTRAPAVSNRFHDHIRMRQASALEAIALVGPREVRVDDLREAVEAGREILDALPTLNGEFLLKGVTGIARRDWGTALANLWIVVEQVTSHLWELHMVKPAQAPNPIPGRAKQLADFRTWTAAARHELLHQIGVLPRRTLAKLSKARKARNDLAHVGKHPTETAAQSAYSAALELIQVALPKHTIPLISLDLADHALSDPFAPREPSNIDPTHWMPIPKLPGEEELERLEAKQRKGSDNQKELD